jgi:hypothetical protein
MPIRAHHMTTPSYRGWFSGKAPQRPSLIFIQTINVICYPCDPHEEQDRVGTDGQRTTWLGQDIELGRALRPVRHMSCHDPLRVKHRVDLHVTDPASVSCRIYELV